MLTYKYRRDKELAELFPVRYDPADWEHAERTERASLAWRISEMRRIGRGRELPVRIDLGTVPEPAEWSEWRVVLRSSEENRARARQGRLFQPLKTPPPVGLIPF